MPHFIKKRHLCCEHSRKQIVPLSRYIDKNIARAHKPPNIQARFV
jgi:hypothetical protein